MAPNWLHKSEQPIRSRVSKLTQVLTITTTHKFPSLVGGSSVAELGVAGEGGGQEPLVGQGLKAQHLVGGLARGTQAEGGGHPAQLVLAQRQVPETFAVVVSEIMEGIT